MGKKIKWGIISTGHISGKFATALALLPKAELVAVASRDSFVPAAILDQPTKTLVASVSYPVINRSLNSSYLNLTISENVANKKTSNSSSVHGCRVWFCDADRLQ